MMGWLSRSASTPVTGGGFIDRKRVEPGAAFSLLENHWKQAKAVMDNVEDSGSHTASDALTVISHLNQMVSFLKLTKNEDRGSSNCKQFWINNRCSDKVLQWLHSLQIKGILLEHEDEKKLVQTLESLCEIAAHDGELLGYNSKGKDSQKEETSASSSQDITPSAEKDILSSSIWDGACSLASLLLEYSLKSDPSLGEPARNSFIILVQLSAKLPELERCFSQETGLGLTNMVISGLSACFAQLPTFSAGTPEQLQPFITQLKFVDAVTHGAPAKVSRAIADCFSTAFLQAVILPALTQDEGNRSLHRQDDHFVTSLHEEISIVTDYLKIVCENMTHPLLIRSIMTFVLNDILQILIQRMCHQNMSVTVSTLGLLSVLLSLYCEDLWHELILKYLMNQNHLMVSQRRSHLPDIDYQEASLRFLSLIPPIVVEVMGPEAISYHYLQYMDNALNRLPFIFSEEFSSQPNPIGRNSVFPYWKYKYDGTDEVTTLKSPQSPSFSYPESSVGLTPQSSTEKFRDPLGLGTSSIEGSEPAETGIPTNICNGQKEPLFTTISLQQTDEQLHSLGGSVSEDPSHPSLIINANDSEIGRSSDGYGSLEFENQGPSSTSSTEIGASYGPFLDILLNHLKNAINLPPDMILMVTEILSTLAGSRVPLVTSILLDTTIILQPSYISFPMLLNRTRVEFEQGLRSNLGILQEVWTNCCKDVQFSQQHLSSSFTHSASMNFMQSLSNSFDSSFGSTSGGDGSFTENIKKKITNSASLGPLLNNVFQRKSSTGSISKSSLPSSSSPTIQGGSGNRFPSEIKETRFMDSAESSPNLISYKQKTGQQIDAVEGYSQPSQSPEVVRITATKAIYFSHWLLELAAIAQQLCWKRIYMNS